MAQDIYVVWNSNNNKTLSEMPVTVGKKQRMEELKKHNTVHTKIQQWPSLKTSEVLYDKVTVTITEDLSGTDLLRDSNENCHFA